MTQFTMQLVFLFASPAAIGWSMSKLQLLGKGY